MNEVEFFGEDKELVAKFNSLKDKSLVAWGDEKYSRVRKTIKDHYLKEQDYTCFFCKQRIVVKNNRAWDAEHLISKSSHPVFMFEPKNLCISCPDCNNEKNDKRVLDREDRVRFPTLSKAYKIVHPHFDNYEDHLKVIVPGELYQYRHNSKKGLFTYRTYGLDRFMEDAGRAKGIDPKFRDLLISVLISTKNSESIEDELLEELLLKRSAKIGSKETLDVIKKLRK